MLGLFSSTTRDESYKLTLFNSMTAAQLQDIRDYASQGYTVVSVNPTDRDNTIGFNTQGTVIEPQFGVNYGCREVAFVINRYNGGGNNVWRYIQYFNWCYNNKLIRTKAIAGTIPKVYGLFWSYEGDINRLDTGGVGQTYFRSTVTGKFSFCMLSPQIGCILQETPVHHHTVLPRGQYQ